MRWLLRPWSQGRLSRHRRRETAAALYRRCFSFPAERRAFQTSVAPVWPRREGLLRIRYWPTRRALRRSGNNWSGAVRARRSPRFCAAPAGTFRYPRAGNGRWIVWGLLPGTVPRAVAPPCSNPRRFRAPKPTGTTVRVASGRYPETRPQTGSDISAAVPPSPQSLRAAGATPRAAGP